MSPEPEHRPARRPRVVVAEDDANMRALVADILRKQALDVEELADGRQLLERVAHASLARDEGAEIDLIVSDVRMPFASGLDVLEKVRHARLGTPVLLMTAFGAEGLESRVRAMGGRLLDKPFTAHALREAVRTLLGRHPDG